MSTRSTSHQPTRMPLILAALAIGALFGLQDIAQGADLSLRPRHRASTGDAATAAAASRIETTGSITPDTVRATHARMVRARFNDARGAMDRAMLIRDAVSKADIAVLDAAMRDIEIELQLLERAAAPGASADAAATANKLVHEWYEAGLQIINPPAAGVIELPMPMTVAGKADAAGAAIDRLITEVNADRPAQQTPAARSERHTRARAGLAAGSRVSRDATVGAGSTFGSWR
jgi:hypothetical protein